MYIFDILIYRPVIPKMIIRPKQNLMQTSCCKAIPRVFFLSRFLGLQNHRPLPNHHHMVILAHFLAAINLSAI
jgi:hypothetical protein